MPTGRGARPALRFFLLGWLPTLLLANGVSAQVNPDMPNFQNWVAYEPPTQAPYLWGNLTWNGPPSQGGQGGLTGAIAWTENPPTQEVSPPTGTRLVSTAASFGRVLIGTDASPMPVPDVFTSDPLPFSLALNASRLLQLDVAIQWDPQAPPFALPDVNHPTRYGYSPATPCPVSLDVELRAGETWVAGAVAGHYIDWGDFPTGQVPQDPPGFATCRYRMPPEIARLEAGSVLELKLVHIAQAGQFAYGFGPAHPSQLRIAYYGPDDAFFRDAGNAGPAPAALGAPPAEPAMHAADLDEGPSSSERLAFAAPMGLFGLPMAGTIRRRLPLVALLLMATSMSACIGGSGNVPLIAESSTSEGVMQASLVKDSKGQWAKGGKGAILGLVQDDLSIPLRNVRVGLDDRGDAAASDARGRFQLLSVGPGNRDMAFNISGHWEFRPKVPVKAGHVTHLEVTLLPLSVQTADARAHKHDYWEAKTEVKALDVDVVSACNGTSPSSEPCIVPFRLPAATSGLGNIIKPGTYELEVKATFAAREWGVPRLGLLFHGANEPSSNNWSQLVPRASGAPFRIVANWEMGDVGHQRFSAWDFRFFVPPEDSNFLGAASQDVTGVSVTPKVHVEMTLRKGVVPTEPGHPDHWGPAKELVLLQDDAEGEDSCPSPRTGFEPDVYVVNWGAPTRVVPERTASITVTVGLSRATATTFAWTLSYRSADRPPEEGTPHSAGQGTSSGNSLTWTIDVASGGVDDVYAKRSNWYFTMRPVDPNAACADAAVMGPQDPLVLTAGIVASREG